MSAAISSAAESHSAAVGHDYARVKAELQRLMVELRLHDAALDAISAGVLIFDMRKKGRPIMYANRAVTERAGYALLELLGQPSSILTPKGPNGDRVLSVRDAMRDGRELRIELITQRKNGSYYWGGLTLTPIVNADAVLTHYVCISADITARRAASLETQRDRARLRAVIESALDGIIAIDQEQKITLFNRSAEEIFRCRAAHVVGQPLSTLLPERFRESHESYVRRFIASGESKRSMMGGETALIGLRADGEEFHFEASIARASVENDTVLIVMLRDISERLKAEQERGMLEGQLRLAQKLEAVGSLAAGVAHEINTPIQYVGDSVHFLEGACQDMASLIQKYREGIAQLVAGADAQSVQRNLEQAEQAADIEFVTAEMPKAFERTREGVERVAKIVRAMKELSHPDAGEQNPADINHALETTLIVAKNEYKYSAEVTTSFAELPPVVCNISELNQVFLNLLVNAAHAIADAGRDANSGRISIATRLVDANVEIEFTDNGCGIPKENLEKIFNPFFTTKEVGRGTGQGLAITRSIIVDKHKGSVIVDSKVGEGTKFVLRLPIAGRPNGEAVQ